MKALESIYIGYLWMIYFLRLYIIAKIDPRAVRIKLFIMAVDP